jgi:hypothetical protein
MYSGTSIPNTAKRVFQLRAEVSRQPQKKGFFSVSVPRDHGKSW